MATAKPILRRRYSEKVKRDAIQRVIRGEGKKAVADDIGCSDALIHRWGNTGKYGKMPSVRKGARPAIGRRKQSRRAPVIEPEVEVDVSELDQLRKQLALRDLKIEYLEKGIRLVVPDFIG